MKNKNNILIMIILSLAVGFAAVSTSLIINGTLNIGYNKDSFDKSVIFTEASIEDGGTAEILEDGKKIKYTSKVLTLLNDKSVLKFKVTNKSRQYDATAILNCVAVSTDYLELDYNPKEEFNLNSLETKLGDVTATMKKAYTEDENKEVEVTCTLIATPKEKDSEPTEIIKNVKVISGFGTNVGDELAIGDEHFYVISSDNNYVTALAKYNLEVGNSTNSYYPVDNETNIQSPRALGYTFSSDIPNYGTVKYSTTSNEYSGSIVEGYVNNYVSILNSTYDLSLTGRLITKEELESLNCKSASTTCEEAPNWVYSTTYWTSTKEENRYLWYVTKRGEFSSSNVDYSGISSNYKNGVRPVVVIPLSDIF